MSKLVFRTSDFHSGRVQVVVCYITDPTVLFQNSDP